MISRVPPPIRDRDVLGGARRRESRLLVTDDHVEHWLNGVMTATYPIDVPFDSPVVLQHHSSEVRVRSIQIRQLVN